MADEKIKAMTNRSTIVTVSAMKHARGYISIPSWFCRAHGLGYDGPIKEVDIVTNGVRETFATTSGYEIKANPDTELFRKARPGARLTIELIHPKPLKGLME